MKNVQIGDSVYCLIFGEGKVIDITHNNDNPVVVEDNYENVLRYNYNGEPENPYRNTLRTLFYSKPKFDIPPEPKRPVFLHGYRIEGFLDKNSYRSYESCLVVTTACKRLYHTYSCIDGGLLDFLFEHHLMYPNTEEGKRNATRHGKILLGIYEDDKQRYDNFESGDVL